MNSSSINGFSLSFMLHALFAFTLFFFMQSKDVIKESDTLKRLAISLSSFETPQKAVQHKNIEAETPRPHRKAKHHEQKASIHAKKEPVIAKPPIENKPIVAETKQESVTKEVADLKQEIVQQEKPSVTKEESIAQTVSNTQQTVKSQEEEMQEFVKTNFKSIRDLVLSNLTYPHIARRMGQSGIVKIVLVIDTSGKLLDVVLEKSSGHKILDSCAIDTAKRLSDQELPIPKTIAKVTLPINFALN